MADVWLDWLCSKMGYVVLQCRQRDKASSCCKKDGDELVLMVRLEFVRRGFLVGLHMPLTHCAVSKRGKKTCYLFLALMPCQLID